MIVQFHCLVSHALVLYLSFILKRILICKASRRLWRQNTVQNIWEFARKMALRRKKFSEVSAKCKVLHRAFFLNDLSKITSMLPIAIVNLLVEKFVYVLFCHAYFRRKCTVQK